jgi:hypothetical protein
MHAHTDLLISRLRLLYIWIFLANKEMVSRQRFAWKGEWAHLKSSEGGSRYRHLPGMLPPLPRDSLLYGEILVETRFSPPSPLHGFHAASGGHFLRVYVPPCRMHRVRIDTFRSVYLFCSRFHLRSGRALGARASKSTCR